MKQRKVRHKGVSFIIDSGIALPASTGGRRPGSVKYPFRDMQIGDSLFLEIKAEPGTDAFEREAKRIQSNLSGAVRRYRKVDPGFYGASRRMERDPKTKKPGVRFWRTDRNGRTRKAA